MSNATVATFEDATRDLHRYFETKVLPELAPIDAAAEAAARALAIRESNEVQNRKYLIDKVLEALGWPVDLPKIVVVEDEIGPLPSGGLVSPGESRFIDYHGIERDGITPHRSLLLVEAKRLSKHLPNPQTAGFLDHSGLIAAAVAARMKLEDAPKGVTKEWSEWIDSIADYVKRVRHVYGYAPKRAVITNGNWYVIFLDPEEAFVSDAPAASQIVVFRDLSEVLRSARTFFGSLAYDALRGVVPPQRPTQLSRFVGPGQRVACVIAARIDYQRVNGRRQPLLLAEVCAWIKTPAYGWVLFEMDFGENFIPWRSGAEGIATVLGELSRRRDMLMQELQKHATLDILLPESLGTAPTGLEPIAGAKASPEKLICISEQQHYLLSVGKDATYIAESASFDHCRFHTHGGCQEAGSAAPGSPILASSVNPPAFFPSGSPFHCAHASVHAQRDQKCVIRPFEKFFCCRRCVFFASCWPDGGNGLPCRPD